MKGTSRTYQLLATNACEKQKKETANLGELLLEGREELKLLFRNGSHHAKCAPNRAIEEWHRAEKASIGLWHAHHQGTVAEAVHKVSCWGGGAVAEQ
jgi:hypothetical protein